MNKFTVGQRVLYTSPDNTFIASWFHVASMGNGELVMHLNAKDEQGRIKPITGKIGKVLPEHDGSTSYDFFPDGWIVPASGWPRGFQCPEEQLQALVDPGLVLPGTLTNKLGKNVSVA